MQYGKLIFCYLKIDGGKTYIIKPVPSHNALINKERSKSFYFTFSFYTFYNK